MDKGLELSWACCFLAPEDLWKQGNKNRYVSLEQRQKPAACGPGYPHVLSAILLAHRSLSSISHFFVFVPNPVALREVIPNSTLRNCFW